MPDDLAAKFTPDYTPEQMENLGVYDALYRGQGPRLASLGEWKPEWISEHDPKGWAQWYKRYASGRRIPEEDERQMKRWLSFKARHGGPFAKNPTPRRGWALRNWGIDPANLVPNEARNSTLEMLDEYQRKAMQKHIAAQQKQGADTFSLAKPAVQPQPTPTTTSIANAPSPRIDTTKLKLNPAPAKAPGVPTTGYVSRILGRELPTTSLSNQIGRWYQNTGALNTAVSAAQTAQQRRNPAILDEKLWPKWQPEHIQRTPEVDAKSYMRGLSMDMDGIQGQWSPVSNQVDVQSTGLHPQATLEHELSHDSYLRNLDIAQNQKQQFAVTDQIAAANEKRPGHERYLLDPAETDVRLAEIKRRYAHHTGNLVKTPEEAEQAWNWWRNHQQFLQQPTYRGQFERPEDVPTMDSDAFNLYDEMPERVRQQYFHRMPELVQRQQQPAYKFGMALGKQATVQQKQAANSADGRAECQFGGDVKQADFGQQFGNAISGWANNAIQTPLGQTALGGVAHAYNNYMPQAGKDVVKKMVPHYGSPEQIQNYGMQGKWQPEPFENQSFQHGSLIQSNDQLTQQTDHANPQNSFKTFSSQIQSHDPVKVTGSPLQQLGHGLSGGVLPGQTFQSGQMASLHTNLSHGYDTRNENKTYKTMTRNLAPLPPQFSDLQKQNSWRERLKQAELLPDIQLQEHQQRIADRVTGGDNRLLVYHGLGSGKSLSALAAAEAAKKVYGDEYGVVVPAALKGNFDKEVKKFTTGSNPEIMSYTGLGLGKQFQAPPQTLVMDEAHRLRNPGGAAAQAASREARKAKNLLLLTGSPVTNSPTDLANLLSLLHNKKITPEQFEDRYIGYKNVSPGVINWLRGIQSGEQPVIKNESELRGLLKGKVDYQPSKTPDGVNVDEQTVHVPLSPAQQKIQKAIRTKIPPGFLWKLDREFPLSRDELSKLNSFLTGLRQVSISTRPFRADKDPNKAFEQSAKLQQAFKDLQETLQSDERKKAIIYSNHIEAGLAPYAAALGKNNIPHALFHGSISPRERQRAVNEYNEGKLRALLIGPAGAEGLSTKGTSLIQLLDPHWHESRSQQAKGRGLRFDSHRDLPEELKNVAVKRYLSSSEDPSWVGKLMGYQRERTGDEILEHLAKEKEMLNDKFREILKQEGAVKAGAVMWFREKQSNSILQLPWVGQETTPAKRKKKPKRARPIISRNGIAGAVGAGAAAMPLISLHQDAFGAYPVLKDRVKGLRDDELFFAPEIAKGVDAHGKPLIQHGDVGTYFGEPQGLFKGVKPNFSKLTQGGEWTSGTGTFHGMMLRPYKGDVQVLEGGDAFPSYDIDPKDPKFLTSSIFDYIRKRDAEEAAAGKIKPEDVGLYALAKKLPDGTENPKTDPNLRDLANNTSGGFFNRNFLAMRNAMEGGAGDAAKMPFFKRYLYYNQQFKRQNRLLKEYLETIKDKPEEREKIWGNLSERTTSPILISRSHHMANLLRNPKTRQIAEDRVNKAYRDYAYRPYDLFSAMRAGAGRVLFPKIAPQETQLGFNPSPEQIPATPKQVCTEDYCVQPLAKTLSGLGTPLGVSPNQALPADMAAGAGFGRVGLVIPSPSPAAFKTLYGDAYMAPTKQKLEELYGSDAPIKLLTGDSDAAKAQRKKFEKDYAELLAKRLSADEQGTADYKRDYRNKVLQWMRTSRNRRIMTGLAAAGLMGAAGYGGTKLVQNWWKKRQERLDREAKKKKKPRIKKPVDKMVEVSKAAAAQYFTKQLQNTP